MCIFPYSNYYFSMFFGIQWKSFANVIIRPTYSCVFDGIILQMPVINIFCFFNIWNNFGILVDLYDIIAILTKLVIFSSCAAVFQFRIFLVFCYRFLFFRLREIGVYFKYDARSKFKTILVNFVTHKENVVGGKIDIII